MMNRMIAILMLVVGAGMFGCDEKLFDCRDICQTVQSCITTNIDVSDCTSRCGDFAETSTAAQDQVEACNDCLDTRACGQGADCRTLCTF